jgi:hypothetical protein
MYGIFDGYYYSRPVSYRSYYPRVQKPFVLSDHLDRENDVIKGILSKFRQEFEPKDTLARGIHWNDFVFGKRHFNHNSYETEWFVHQWKPTNDLQEEHPTGTRQIYHKFEDFAAAVEKLVSVPANKLKLKNN